MRAELRTALAEDQFVVHYQPIVPVGGGVVSHFEALVRWEHPDRGLVLPGAFLPAMQDDATIIALGRRVLDQVCRQIAEWREGDPARAVQVSVNLSHQEFWADDLTVGIADALRAHGVPQECLALEITESVIMSNVSAASVVLAQLRALGVELHIDDFGTGHSSLSALRVLPVTTLKIDGSFVQEMSTVPETAALVDVIVQMAGVLGMQVVAECVETAEQARLLRERGCGTAQGWFFSPAVPGPQAGSLLGSALSPLLLEART